MKDLSVQLDDLPDEILMHIFKKLHNVEVLYSFIGANQRLNKIAHDSIFTNYLPLFLCFSNHSTGSLPNSILHRFCSKILPEIGHQVKSFYLERTSMERILLATNYPNLTDLLLCNIDIETGRSLINDENLLVNIFKNQISTLFISFIHENHRTSENDVFTFIFTQILTIFTNLRRLDFHPTLYANEILSFERLPLTVCSSTLLELHVSLEDFLHCLLLLDGRFDQLRVLYVSVVCTYDCQVPLTPNDRKKLPNLEVFSFYGEYVTHGYEDSIVPLLQRMLNLKKLDLTLVDAWTIKCIDGDTFMNDIIIHMPRLKYFTFNIYSTIFHRIQSDLPSNKYIQETFKYFYNQIITCVDRFEEEFYNQYRIYSYPYKLTFYNNITNNFPGGLFNNVKKVSLYDERPFEYEFFLQIGRSFPFIEDLTIRKNLKPQNNKEFIKLENHNQTLSIIEYPNLTELHFIQSHDDYVELFLLHTKVSLPNNVHLSINYEALERVTDNFTRNATRINCAKFVSLRLYTKPQVDEHLKDYFPRVYTR